MLCSGNVVDCPACGGTGRYSFPGCPLQQLPAQTWEIIELACLWDKGLPPVAGGSMDQSRAFVAAARFVLADRDMWRNTLKAKGYITDG